MFGVAGDKSRQMICSHIARLLREERRRQNLSLNALAERAGLSRQMVSYVEQEERNPTLDTLLRISTALGVNLEDLIKVRVGRWAGMLAAGVVWCGRHWFSGRLFRASRPRSVREGTNAASR